MNFVSDEFIYNLMEQGQEAQILEDCVHCKCELYEGEEVVVDAEGNFFCDFSCAKEYYQIEADYNYEDKERFGTCENCGEGLFPYEYDVYTNNWGEAFCSPECAEENVGLQCAILERY